LYYQVAGLRARGHTVEAWCSSLADQNYLPLGGLIREHVLRCEPVSWYDPPPPGRWARLIHPYHLTRKVLRVMEAHSVACAAEISRGGFDVLLAHPCMFLRTPAIGRHLNLPRVLYLQEPDRGLYEADPDWPWAALDLPAGFWRSRRHLARWAKDAVRVHSLRWKAREEASRARSFQGVLVNSLFSRESLLRAYGLDAHVCYLGVDADKFRPTGAPREQMVVSVGALHPTKQVELAIETVGSIAPEKRPALVWIANFANPGYQQAMARLAQDRQVSFTVRLGVADDEVVDWLNRAAVMLYTPRLEPFGLAPLEANACETPVVAVAEGGVRETIVSEVNGVLVLHNDPKYLGAAVLRMLEAPAWARTLGAAGRRMVLERWQWLQSVERLEEQLMNAVETAGRGRSAVI
jgi:glycosyltransferase involved in cell wall biosynthesis